MPWTLSCPSIIPLFTRALALHLKTTARKCADADTPHRPMACAGSCARQWADLRAIHRRLAGGGLCPQKTRRLPSAEALRLRDGGGDVGLSGTGQAKQRGVGLDKG